MKKFVLEQATDVLEKLSALAEHTSSLTHEERRELEAVRRAILVSRIGLNAVVLKVRKAQEVRDAIR